MRRMLINAIEIKKLRIALIDGQQLYDLNVENIDKKQRKSNIYKGKIVRIEPSLEAAFVDYGEKKNGFLPLKEISRNYFPNNCSNYRHLHIKNILKEGQECIVQIDKEERGTKGALLTTFISLAGNYLVLMPNCPHLEGISRKIEGIDRFHLKKIISMLMVPENMGIIIRTSGVGRSIETLQLDLNFRVKNWYTIKKSAEINTAPCLIHKESNIVIRTLRDYLKKDIQEIIVDNPEILELARDYMFNMNCSYFEKKIKLYTGSDPLFSYYKIESQINALLRRIVKLPSGGSIIIDYTEALTAIDINSSQSTKGVNIEETAFNTNYEAVREIARQLRLRDLGGLIVIDFIDMSVLKHQKMIELHLHQVLQKDRARVQVGSISQFGLLEMSRQCLGSPLKKINHNYLFEMQKC
ncbi:ribonuclease G [Buchnera aphidicola str. Bp (Baizongia pistaciae)]|uniref:Putative ribonuclease E n=1 Tax=Buchnera aphidicola subsp. Baizongia pistaciae (strain Bp) TaxID=224915 RepID=RNE_BUCBP|nr:RecName: Full=Putative ribonuclease E; Short=RNase E [Buchnera aphidicola str. Bp (Baizongia pistaciae)]AAO27039.1 ribonuclease G [Buchnera aphidicola str. Bp (Baizongia pistaciae)]